MKPTIILSVLLVKVLCVLHLSEVWYLMIGVCNTKTEPEAFPHQAFALYRITGIFGSHFNLAVWQISLLSPNLNDAN